MDQPLIDLAAELALHQEGMWMIPEGITKADYDAVVTFLMERKHRQCPWQGAVIQRTSLGNIMDMVVDLTRAGFTIHRPTEGAPDGC